MWKSFGLVLFSGLLAGSFVGVFEAMTLLLAVGAGQYDALLWGGVGYAVLGMILSMGCCMVAWRWTPPKVFVRVFTLITALLMMWVFQLSVFWLPLALLLYWLLGVLVHRTPMRIILSPKGAVGVLSLWNALLFIFSLTPSQRIYSPPNHQYSADGKPNILLIVVDGLSDELLQRNAPSVSALSKSAWHFTNAFSNSPDRFQSMASLLTSSAHVKESPLADALETLPERLAYEGYETRGMVSHLAVGRFANLHQGFDRFRYLPPLMSSMVLRWGLGNEGTRHLALAKQILKYFPPEDRPMDEVVQFFQNDLHTVSKGPWFGMLHLLIPQHATPHELRTLDREMGVLIRRVSKDSIVVLTASFQYGQGYGFHRLPAPLLMWVPNSTPRIIHNNVLLSDIPITLTSLIGVATGRDWLGKNMLRLPPMEDQRLIEVVHSDWVWRQQGNWRWIKHHSDETLYDVSKDPDMNVNLAAENPVILQQMRSPHPHSE